MLLNPENHKVWSYQWVLTESVVGAWTTLLPRHLDPPSDTTSRLLCLPSGSREQTTSAGARTSRTESTRDGHSKTVRAFRPPATWIRVASLRTKLCVRRWAWMQLVFRTINKNWGKSRASSHWHRELRSAHGSGTAPASQPNIRFHMPGLSSCVSKGNYPLINTRRDVPQTEITHHPLALALHCNQNTYFTYHTGKNSYSFFLHTHFQAVSPSHTLTDPIYLGNTEFVF